jgi:hypothetical protein
VYLSFVTVSDAEVKKKLKFSSQALEYPWLFDWIR